MTRKPSQRQQDAHRRKVEAAYNAWSEASSAVTTWAIEHGYGSVKWNDLQPIAEKEIPTLLASQNKARQALEAAEQAAIDAWCAYRGTFNLLSWIHH